MKSRLRPVTIRYPRLGRQPYIRDMLVRVSTEPASRVRELLPDRWPGALVRPTDSPAADATEKAERDAVNREVAAAVSDPPDRRRIGLFQQNP